MLDDEDAICALVTCALEPQGYQVTEARSLTPFALRGGVQSGRRLMVIGRPDHP